MTSCKVILITAKNQTRQGSVLQFFSAFIECKDDDYLYQDSISQTVQLEIPWNKSMLLHVSQLLSGGLGDGARCLLK